MIATLKAVREFVVIAAAALMIYGFVQPSTSPCSQSDLGFLNVQNPGTCCH
jgi:hypothetical protein